HSAWDPLVQQHAVASCTQRRRRRVVTAAGDLRRRLGGGSTRVPLVGAASLVGGPSGVFPRIASGLGGLKDPVGGGLPTWPMERCRGLNMAFKMKPSPLSGPQGRRGSRRAPTRLY